MSRDDRSQYQLSAMQPAGVVSATSNQRVSSPVNQQPAPAASNQSKLPHDANLQVRPTKSSEYNTNRVIRIQYQPRHPYTILQYTSLRPPPGARLTRQSTIYIQYTRLRGDARTVGTKSSVSHSNAIQKLIRCEKRARATKI